MKKILLALTIFSSMAPANPPPEIEFEKSKRQYQKEQERKKKLAPLIELEERAHQAALRLGLRVEEFTFKVNRRKAYLQSPHQVCKLLQGQKTVRGIDCGLTYPSPWAVLGNRCFVDNPDADQLECYPIQK